MRYPAAEKLEIIRLVEQSALPVRRTLAHLGIPRATFYRWCEQFLAGGPEALVDTPSRPDRVWNRIPDDVRGRVVDLALAEPDCRRASWRRGSPMPRGTPSRKPRCIACSRRMT